MTKPLFDVTLRCTGDELLKIVTRQVEHPGTYIDSQVAPSGDGAIAPPAPPKANGNGRHYANGKHDKGVRGDHLVLMAIKTSNKEERASDAEIAQAFRAFGFADNSVRPYLGAMLTAGIIAKDSAGYFTICKRVDGDLLSLLPERVADLRNVAVEP